MKRYQIGPQELDFYHVDFLFNTTNVKTIDWKVLTFKEQNTFYFFEVGEK